jgi:TRAP-type C4-dicarboxylate transport system permease small subunit
MRVPAIVKVFFTYAAVVTPLFLAHSVFADSSTAGTDQVNNFLQNILNYGGGILGTFAGLALLWSGFQYMSAGGNLQQLEKAKSHMKWTLVGLVVGIGAVTIANTVISVSSPLK